MSCLPGRHILPFFVVLLMGLSHVSGSLAVSKGPTVSEAQSVPETGRKARIAVAQFVNNTGGLEAQMQRMAVSTQAQMANMGREMLEFQKKMVPYQQALMEWQAKIAAVGEEKAGPAPKPPEFSTSSSPYMATVSDPVAGGLRDMMVNALFNSKKFIVLERQTIEQINWEQEFSQSGRVGEKTKVPIGQIEGAELLLIGSLTTMEAEQSGGGVAAPLSMFLSSLAKTSLADANVGVSWKKAKAAMEIRVIDARTSRVVAATTVHGQATDISLGASQESDSSYYDAGELPAGFSAFKKTPVEEAFRKMVHAAIKFLVTKTPEGYFRGTKD